MSHPSMIGRMLHEEHLETSEAMNTLEEMIDGRHRNRPPDVAQPAVRDRLCALIAAVDHDLCRHFQFEERDLFPLLAKAGLADVTAMLVHEHDTIRALAARLQAVAIHGLQHSFDKAAWRNFCDAGMDLVPSVLFHIQKEEVSVIRQLDVLLDEATDRQLAATLTAEAGD
ncbi:MAG: hemerythrin domain-containing protein [Rhodospirillales bacterium]